jgi:hypothetical protein
MLTGPELLCPLCKSLCNVLIPVDAASWPSATEPSAAGEFPSGPLWFDGTSTAAAVMPKWATDSPIASVSDTAVPLACVISNFVICSQPPQATPLPADGTLDRLSTVLAAVNVAGNTIRVNTLSTGCASSSELITKGESVALKTPEAYAALVGGSAQHFGIVGRDRRVRC